jgi:hypothetical protein
MRVHGDAWTAGTDSRRVSWRGMRRSVPDVLFPAVKHCIHHVRIVRWMCQPYPHTHEVAPTSVRSVRSSGLGLRSRTYGSGDLSCVFCFASRRLCWSRYHSSSPLCSSSPWRQRGVLLLPSGRPRTRVGARSDGCLVSRRDRSGLQGVPLGRRAGISKDHYSTIAGASTFRVSGHRRRRLCHGRPPSAEARR